MNHACIRKRSNLELAVARQCDTHCYHYHEVRERIDTRLAVSVIAGGVFIGGFSSAAAKSITSQGAGGGGGAEAAAEGKPSGTHVWGWGWGGG